MKFLIEEISGKTTFYMASRQLTGTVGEWAALGTDPTFEGALGLIQDNALDMGDMRQTRTRFIIEETGEKNHDGAWVEVQHFASNGEWCTIRSAND